MIARGGGDQLTSVRIAQKSVNLRGDICEVDEANLVVGR